jgi:hypothetical protein
MTHPARCPGCGQPATNSLFSDPSIPIYGCGSWATMAAFPCRPRSGAILSSNVQRVDSADMREILDLVDMASVAVMRAAG